MKKYLLSIALLIAVSISAKAQFSLGIKGGLNFSKINSDNFRQSTLVGYEAGVWARAGKGFYVQPELYLGSSGGKFTFNSNNANVTESGNVRFTTLNVPLLLGKGFGSKNLNFRLMVGPEYSYILKKNESVSGNANGAISDFGSYKNSTLGFQAGAGVDLGNISIDGRYEGGLTKINDSFGQKQKLWILSVGFKLF